ncbi:MAG: leukotoxin LktA family filamentous adhesin [Phascolarctobacterium sp.]|nr:leukotoxin LktA family filamentous adhesin [Phascolarctobacterium sp.]
MTRFAKNSWYTHKNLGSKQEDSALRMKVLRYVMAVGFVLSPWLGGEAYAAGIERIDGVTLPNSDVKQAYFTGDDGNVAHIYAEQAHGDVGLNRFQKFEVGANQIANMHFQTAPNGTTLNHLVNTVEGEINISGTVNAIRNNKIGGNLYFMSPKGMVVGSTGVINAGSLTVLANNDTFTTAEGAHYAIYEAVKDYQYWKSPNIDSYITINGKINTETGIDLRAAVVQIKQATSNSVSPSLLTGVVFNEVVNTDKYDNIQIYPINEKRLTLTNENGKIVIKNPTTLEEITSDGNGKINIYARNFNVGSFIGTFALNHGSIDSVGELRMDVGTSITVDSNTSIKANQITILNHSDNFVNNGTITGSDAVSIVAGNTYYKELSSINNVGTIESEAGIMSFTATNSFTNTGTIQADGQIKFAVGGTLTNKGTIESTSSNVQAHIGRNFKNIAVYNNESTENRTLKGGIIEAGGNVQVDYNLDNEGIGAAKEAGTIDGIYNSGLIWAKGENGQDPVYDDKGNIVNSGSGNIWLTSSYNITNEGTIEAGRQITLNARDFLHNHGLIQGVTYLDIKSIMGYVYNHDDGIIRSTGGNIDLSSGQANLQIKGDTDGQRKEEYRKFTPIIIEGLVEATSDKNNTTSQTNQGDIKITAHLGDIYVVEGTIRANAKPVTSGEKESAAGDVILDAARNITIGFKTEYAEADDPTTDGANAGKSDEREYYRPILDSNLVPSSPCDEPATISGSNITLTSGDNEKYYILISNTTTGSNALPASNTLTASNAITINTDSMNIVGGTFNAGTLEAVLAENGALNITGGTINAANVNSNRNMIINGGAINTGTAQGSLSANNISMESGTVSGKDVTIAADDQVELKGGSITAEAEGAGKLTVTAGTDLVHNGAIITADNAAFSAGNKIDLKSGSLTATGAAAFGVTTGTAGANSIVESTSGYSLSAGSLSLSANQGNITLNGANNVLQGVTLANVGGNVEIVNGNETNNKVLTVATTNGTTVGGTINVTNNGEGITVEGINATNNVSLAADKGIAVTGSLTTTGNVGLDADEGITVDGKVSAVNANLKAAKSIEVAGSVEATNNASLTAGEGIAVNNVSAQEKASFSAGLDFSHSNGVIKTKEVEVIAGRDVKLNAGSMEASTSVSLTAGSTTSVAEGHGYISEGTEYALIAPQVTASAVKAITLDSSANQLVNVDITQVGGDLAIGSGNKNSTEALQVNIAQGITVNGSLTIKNYKDVGDNSSNDIVLAGALSANRITITNAEADINAGTDAVISADSISLQANSGAVNVDGNATITARNTAENNGTFAANAQDINIAGGQITADTVTLTAANAINQTAGSIVATTTVASAGTDLSLASNANKLQNVTVKANNGSASIVSGNDAGVALKVQTDGTVGGSLSIQSTSDIVSEGTISAAGDVTMTAGDKVTINSGTINANSVTAKDTDLFVNGGAINVGTLAASKGLNIASNSSNTTNITANNITAGGSIGITGGNVVTTSVAADEALNITGGTVSSDGAVSLSGATGVTIGSAATINTGGDLTISSSGGSVTNNRALTANSGSVTLSGQTDVTNSANITAAQDVTMTATTGNVNNSKVVKASGGNINLTAGTNINLQDGYGLEASDTINLNTDNIEITGGTIKANTLAASGSLNITGGKVDSTGALTISGAKGVTIGSQADITTGNNLTIASSGGAVENNRILNITTGSVTLSGSGGVTNNMNITAAQDIIWQSTTGAITNSGILSAGQGIGLTSTEGTILNNGMLTARGSSVSLKGYKGIINNGYIEAKGNVSIISEDGSITNRAGIVAGKSFATPAASPFSLRARAMARAVDNGSVVISGKDGVINHNDNVNTSISAAGSVSITSEVGAVQNSSAVNTSGSVEISGSNVTNSGALTTTGGSVEISGSEGVTNNADIKAGSGVSLNATTGDVKTSGTIQAGEDVSMTSNAGKIESSSAVTTSGSVTMSGSSVDNTGALTANTGSVTISGSSGVDNSANITANDSVTMSSGAGSVTNSSDVKAGTGSVEISGNGGVTNTADITANQNVNLSANAGAISNAGSVTAETGNIGLNSNNGITSTAEGSSLNVNSLNGSISAATTYGEVNISEIIAGGNATASSQNGSVSIGTVAGNDVVLTGGSNVTIGSVTGSDVAITGGSNSDVNVDNITVDNSLKLQGDNITATNVNRSENASGVLNVDVSGAGGTSSTAQGDVNLKIDGDVVFNNLNVTDAKIETTGTLDASKMHVEGKAQITSSNTTVNVYGKDVTPDPNDRNAIQDKGGGVSLTIDSNGVKSDDLGMDYPVQLSGKLVDYDPYDTYLEHYGDVADIFGRTDLIEVSERPSGEVAPAEEGSIVVLKQDAEGLRIEEQKKEE